MAERVAIVTGGGSGIGRAAAQRFAAEGASVVVADIDHGAAAETVELIGDDRAVAIRADVTSEVDVEAMVATAIERFGRLDYACNNAGMSGAFSFTADCTTEQWERTVATNLTSVFLCMRAEIRHLLEHGGGAIVNTASSAGLMGFAGLPAYVASKHGVVGLTKAAALEYARRGIRVNAVCPGGVHTPMLAGFVGGDEQALDRMGRSQPIGRLGTAEEIAEAIVWLCSDAASYVTGHAMPVDGGVMAT